MKRATKSVDGVMRVDVNVRFRLGRNDLVAIVSESIRMGRQIKSLRGFNECVRQALRNVGCSYVLWEWRDEMPPEELAGIDKEAASVVDRYVKFSAETGGVA